MFVDDFDDDPGTYSDADILQAQYEAESRRYRAARKAGRCTHGSAVGYREPAIYTEQQGLEPGQLRCTAGCGRIFESDNAWHTAIHEAIA